MTATSPDFVISRLYAAPRTLVWEALTTPDAMAKWWGPKGVTVKVRTLDFRPGGLYHYSMHTPDGVKMWARFLYREIAAPGRLVFVNSFSNEAGELAPVPFPGGWPAEMLCTFTLTERDGGTEFHVRSTPLNATAEECKTFADNFGSMTDGWKGTLDQLADYLKERRA